MIYHTQKERQNRLDELNKGTEEFCVLCLELMGFPLATHIESPIRWKNDASYTEGAGQTCGECNRASRKANHQEKVL